MWNDSIKIITQTLTSTHSLSSFDKRKDICNARNLTEQNNALPEK